jgi:hypothetical protein
LAGILRTHEWNTYSNSYNVEWKILKRRDHVAHVDVDGMLMSKYVLFSTC